MGKGRCDDVHDATDGWGGEPEHDDAASAFGRDDGRERRVTLTVSAPPLTLPEDESPGGVTQRTPVPIGPLNYDGWNADRLKRSSLPPTSSLPPAPVTPVPSRPDDGDNDGDAFALVSRSSSTSPAFDLVAEMAERFALGDFSGSLRAAELLLGRDPQHVLAQHYARETYTKLEVLYCSRLDAQGRIPCLALAENEVRWLGLDPQVGHLIARIDGIVDYEQVVAASGMPRLAALRTLVELVDGRVVRLM